MGPTARRILRSPSLAVAALLLPVAAGGCAGGGQPSRRPPLTGPATFRLEQIPPVPVLAGPATLPADGISEPSDEALHEFARARLDRADGLRGTAVASLRRAAAADPYSCEIQYALGKALRSGVGFDPAVVAAFERAAELQPDHMDVQLDLARQYLAKGDSAEGLRRLRLAAQTSQYAAADDRAPEVDLLLGHTLAELHYDRAAVDRLETLVGRIDRGEVRWADEVVTTAQPALSDPADPGESTSATAPVGERGGDRPAADGYRLRSRFGAGGRRQDDDDAEAQGPGSLVTRVHLQLGDLYLRQDRPADALAAYRRAEATPGGRDNPEVGGRLVLGLMAVGRVDEGLRLAADAVVWFRGSPAAVTVLRQAYRAVDRPAGAAEALRSIHGRRPDDSAVLFALCDVLAGDEADRAPEADRSSDVGGGSRRGAAAAAGSRPIPRSAGTSSAASADAERLLTSAWARPGSDPAILCRLVNLRLTAGDGEGALRLMVDTLAARPVLAGQLEPAWAAFATPEGRRTVTPETAGRLAVPDGVRAARAYVAWTIASRWPRSGVARRSLDEATAIRPLFAPAFRAKLSAVLSDDGRPQAARLAAAREVADLARSGGDPALSAELEGRIALFIDDGPTARAKLAEAAAGSIGAISDSPDRQLAAALASLANGDPATFVGDCRRLIARHPWFDEAHAALHAHLASVGESAEAGRVLSAWRRAWPAGTVNVAAALARAQDRLAAGRPEAAELALADVDKSEPANPDLLTVLEAIADRTGRVDALVTRLEGCAAEADTLGLAGTYQAALRLARLHLRGGRIAEAVRALDRARLAAASEPDWLYPLASLYATADVATKAEEVLRIVVDLDPSATSAAIDLARAWADRGTNLERAEQLARTASDQGHDDPNALDALGWVLYKQGRADPARDLLLKAVAAQEAAEPSVAGLGTGGAKPGRVDPSVLDHLGDVLYRLGDRDGAGRAWDRCRQRLAEDDVVRATRADLRSLRVTLLRKLKQLRDGQDVRVSAAPTAAGVPTP